MMHAAEGFTVPPFAQVVPEASVKFPLIEIVPRVRGVVPVFSSVIVCAVLVEPTFCGAKFSTSGLSDACGLIGVPVSGTDCGLPAADSVITSEADCVVVWSCAGMKVTRTKQLAFAASVGGHSGTAKNSREVSLLPEMAILLIAIGVLPGLVNVTNWMLSNPTYTLPKFTLDGEIFSVLVAAALTVCVTPAEVLPVKLPSPEYTAVSVRGPVVVKVIEQMPAPDASVAVQVSPVLALI